MKKIVFLTFVVLGIAFAKPLEVGGVIPTFSLQNQFQKPLSITKDTKKLIVVFSKKEGDIVKNFLEKNPNYLTTTKTAYLVDVSEVPSLVMSMFMRPKFKDYNFEMGLLDDENIVSSFPKKEGYITLLELDNKKVTKVEFKKSL